MNTAILLTDWDDPQHDSAPLGVPNCLLPFLDRPALQWVVERLVRLGCTQIHVVLGDHPLPIRAFLEEGARWGCRLVYHHAGAEERFGQIMRRLDLAPEPGYVLANATRLPFGEDSTLFQALPATSSGRAAVWNQDSLTHWGGWGVFTGAWLLAQDVESRQAALEACLLQVETIEKPLLTMPLSAATPAALIESNRRLLSDGSPESPMQRIGRGCTTHPGAQLVPPFLIGQQVKIGFGAIIGPEVVIGDGALIDRDAHLHRSVISPNTYVGEGLELEGAVAREHWLANTRLDTVIEITDSHLLSALPRHDPTASGSGTAGDPWLALALWIVLAPLQTLTYWQARRDPPPRKTLVTLPRPGGAEPIEIEASLANPQSTLQDDGSRRWARHFHQSFYPGLREVMRGRLSLVGPSPRSLAEVRELPEEWRSLYIVSRCGLLNEALLQPEEALFPETRFASDALAQVQHGKVGDTLKLLRQYLVRVMRSLGTRRHS